MELIDRNEKRIKETNKFINIIPEGTHSQHVIELIADAFEAGWDRSESTYWANELLVNNESIPNLLELILMRQKEKKFRQKKRFKKEMEQRSEIRRSYVG